MFISLTFFNKSLNLLLIPFFFKKKKKVKKEGSRFGLVTPGSGDSSQTHMVLVAIHVGSRPERPTLWVNWLRPTGLIWDILVILGIIVKKANN
jgi:hypothetical protein